MNNIVYIGKYSLKEGFQTAEAKRVLNQIKYLEKYFKITVITFSSYKSEYNFHINLKTKHHKNVLDFLKFPFYWFYLSIILIVKIKKNNYLFLESIVETYTILPIFIAKILGYKVIHDIVEDFTLTKDVSKNQKLTFLISDWFEARLIRYCSGIIVISESLKHKYEKKGLPIAKIYNSVNIPENISLVVKNDFITLFYSGSFGTKDGVLDLIEAFNIISKRYKNVLLKLVGNGHGVYFEKCLNEIKKNEKITYLGYVHENEMVENIWKSNLLCVTRPNSDFANFGFPFKLAEYMSFGIPVLTTTVSDIPLILKNNETAFFAIPDNIDSIANTIEFIITNYDFAIQVGENGRKFAQNNFSIDYIGTQIVEFINGL